MRFWGMTACGVLALLVWPHAAGAADPPPAKPDSPDTHEKFAIGPGFRLSKGEFRFVLTGYAQGDFRSYRDWQPAFGDPEEGVLRNDTSELRRLRVGFEARYKRLRAELDVDPRNAEVGDTRLKDAYLDLELADAFRIRGGSFKPPVSGEFLTPASRTDFVERSMLATRLVPDREWGVMAHGQSKRVEYALGVFKGDGRGFRGRAGTTGVGRLILIPLKGLELGGSFAQGDVPAAEGADPETNGLLGEGPSGFRFYNRHFVAGTRRRLGAEASVTRGPFRVGGEWLEAREERKGQGSTFDDLPDEVGRGWAASATWLVTGEKKKRSIEPSRKVPAGIGAIEIGVRYEELRFDDAAGDTGFAGSGNRARNIRPAGDRVLAAGASWWPRSWLRAMGNAAWERYEDPLLAPERGKAGQYLTLIGRLQFQLP
jgi:phosphate-selective porin